MFCISKKEMLFCDLSYTCSVLLSMKFFYFLSETLHFFQKQGSGLPLPADRSPVSDPSVFIFCSVFYFAAFLLFFTNTADTVRIPAAPISRKRAIPVPPVAGRVNPLWFSTATVTVPSA